MGRAQLGYPSFGDTQDPVARLAASGAYGVRSLSINLLNRSNGSATILGAPGAGRRYRMLGAILETTGGADFQFDTTSAALSGVFFSGTTRAFTIPFSPIGWFETPENLALRITISAASGTEDVTGTLLYTEEDAPLPTGLSAADWGTRIRRKMGQDSQDPVARRARDYVTYAAVTTATLAAGGDYVIVPAVAGKRAVLLQLIYDQSVDTDTAIRDSDDTHLSGWFATGHVSPITLPFAPSGWVTTVPGNAIQIRNVGTGATTALGGMVAYTHVD